MGDGPKILIGDIVLTRQDLFQAEEVARRERAKLPLAKKIEILVQLQKLANSWGGKNDVPVWEV